MTGVPLQTIMPVRDSSIPPFLYPLNGYVSAACPSLQRHLGTCGVLWLELMILTVLRQMQWLLSGGQQGDLLDRLLFTSSARSGKGCGGLWCQS